MARVTELLAIEFAMLKAGGPSEGEVFGCYLVTAALNFLAG